ncbi:MAG: lipopolysaccharide transport periplasmic protein LptA [Syntrophales bacterium]|nr:lipopolysaccharide transport periplasmic protein LptA [Syntrophales bacterium]
MRKDEGLCTVYHHRGYGWRLFLLTVVSLFLVPVSVWAQAPKKMKMDKNQPIQIQSDRLDAYQEKNLVIFSGHAVATQGDKTIKADRLLIYYKDKDHPATPEKSNKMDMGEAGDLEKLEAQGQVVITQTNRVVTGDNAVFYQDSQQIVMTGNAVMREGKNIVKGEKIVVFLDEDRGVIEGSKHKRVTATIYPNEKKEEKQK